MIKNYNPATGALEFEPYSDPTDIHRIMGLMREGNREKVLIPRPERAYSPEESAELQQVRERKRMMPHAMPNFLRAVPGASTQFGNVMHDRHQRNVSRLPGAPGQLGAENQMLLRKYGPEALKGLI